MEWIVWRDLFWATALFCTALWACLGLVMLAERLWRCLSKERILARLGSLGEDAAWLSLKVENVYRRLGLDGPLVKPDDE